MSDTHDVPDDEVLPHYDFKGGVRGKYVDRFPQVQGAKLVPVDLELYAFFGDSDAVNSALRALMSSIQEREAKAEADKAEAKEAA